MAVTPAEMLDLIEHALQAPRGPRGTVLTVYTPRVLGETARLIGHTREGPSRGPSRPVYGLTRRQCKRIKAAIHEAARHDVGLA